MNCYSTLIRRVQYSIFAAVALYSMTPVAARADYMCTGTVSRVAISGAGRVSVISQALYPDGQGRDVCNLYSDFRGVPSATCKGWLAALLAAQASGRTVSIQYVDSTYSCASHPAWDGALAPWALFAN